MERLFPWLGSKRWITSRLRPFIRENLTSGHAYWEPFAGSASVFFSVKPERAILVERVSGIISAFNAIKSDPLEVSKRCQNVFDEVLRPTTYTNSYSRFHDYLLGRKEEFDDFDIAASFFLIANTQQIGFFLREQKLYQQIRMPTNPLVMEKPLPPIQPPGVGLLLEASTALQHAQPLLSDSVQLTLDILEEGAIEGDLVFSDPPIQAGAFREHPIDPIYNLSIEEHNKIADTMKRLASRGVTIVVMGPDTPLMLDLYKQFNIRRFSPKQIDPKISFSRWRKVWGQMLATNVPFVSER